MDIFKKIEAADLEKVQPKAEVNFGLGLVETYEQYYQALDAAQMRGIDYIEISDPLFKLITKGENTPYFIKGHPPVYVFIVGTRDKLLAKDKLTSDEVAGLMTGRNNGSR